MILQIYAWFSWPLCCEHYESFVIWQCNVIILTINNCGQETKKRSESTYKIRTFGNRKNEIGTPPTILYIKIRTVSQSHLHMTKEQSGNLMYNNRNRPTSTCTLLHNQKNRLTIMCAFVYKFFPAYYRNCPVICNNI